VANATDACGEACHDEQLNFNISFFDVSTIKEAMLFKLLPSIYQAKT
jgi:hypothetical protein